MQCEKLVHTMLLSGATYDNVYGTPAVTPVRAVGTLVKYKVED